MKDFMMIFRFDGSIKFNPSPEQMQEAIAQWQNWIGNIAAQGKLVGTDQLDFTGKLLWQTEP